MACCCRVLYAIDINERADDFLFPVLVRLQTYDAVIRGYLVSAVQAVFLPVVCNGSYLVSISFRALEQGTYCIGTHVCNLIQIAARYFYACSSCNLRVVRIDLHHTVIIYFGRRVLSIGEIQSVCQFDALRVLCVAVRLVRQVVHVHNISCMIGDILIHIDRCHVRTGFYLNPGTF